MDDAIRCVKCSFASLDETDFKRCAICEDLVCEDCVERWDWDDDSVCPACVSSEHDDG